MAHSLKVKLKNLQRKGELTDNDINKIFKALEQEPKYCDRNICLKNEYNGIGCDECEVTKSQEPSEDKYIKVPKKALKYRTAGMVAYNVEWLKNHFDIERAVICGVQEPCNDATLKDIFCIGCEYKEQEIKAIPSAEPKERSDRNN